MIASVKGKLIKKTSSEAVLECNGVGYLLNISLNTSTKLPDINENVSLNTLLIPREDSLNLYGFFNESEKEAFKVLTSVSGVGPKVAMAILSSITVSELQQFILENNIIALTKMPGIGKKSAERLILELKGKIDKISGVELSSSTKELNTLKQETLAALTTLGYPRQVSEKAINNAVNDNPDESLNVEKLIKLSLKYALK